MKLFPTIPSWLKRRIPAFDWLAHYERKHLRGDALAGVIVATLLIPHAMAYALLAGLPPQVGLYASLLPLAVYALLGSSRFLSVGPSALLSLLILTQVAALAEPGSPRYLAFAMATALIVGVMQIAMGAARLGVLTNFLSQPVLSGFTSAAAIHIALSQVKHLLGVPLPRTDHLHELLGELARAVPQTRWPTVAISIASIVLLLVFQYLLPRVLARWKTFPPALAQSLSKSGPIVVVIVGTAIVGAFHLGASHGVIIIGEIPGGLPRFALPSLAAAEFLPLIPLAFAISFIGFLENISVAKSLAAKRRQKVDSNQEFIALGAATLAAGITGGYPVSGSFARSTVNFTAGANTGLASLITVAVVALAALFLMPLFHHLPQAVLAAIIILAVIGLMDFGMPCRLWRYNRADAAERPQLRHLVMICNAINFIDASALETLTDLLARLQDAGIELYLTEVKGPVMDRLADTEFLQQLDSERIFLTTEEVYEKLASL